MKPRIRLTALLLALTLAPLTATGMPPAALADETDGAIDVISADEQFAQALACYQAQSYRDAARLLEAASQAGHATAMAYLGRCYLSGDGVRENVDTAAGWFRASADAGDALGQAWLGECYEFGVEIDLAQALALYERSADQNEPEGLYHLGFCCQEGLATPVDAARAMALYQAAAAQGEPKAVCQIGYLYANGLGVPVNDEEACAWYQYAAELGLARAQYNLAVHYFYGKGVPKDLTISRSWLEAAAAQGFALAQDMLRKEF